MSISSFDRLHHHHHHRHRRHHHLRPQVEDTFQEGQEKEEQQDKEKIKAEDNAIEMSEDFDGQMHDGDEREEGRTSGWRHCAGFTLDFLLNG